MEKSSNHAGYHLCHLNIGPAKGFIHDPVMADFVANLDAMNNLAYQSLGFVWHLQVDIYNPDDLAMYGEPGLLFNMSVWDSLGSLFSYVYRSEHAKLFKFRHQWFGEMEGPRYVLWWLPEGEIPTLEDAKRRIKYLGANGASVEAFDFKTVFSPDGSIIPAQNFALPSRMQAAREVVV